MGGNTYLSNIVIEWDVGEMAPEDFFRGRVDLAHPDGFEACTLEAKIKTAGDCTTLSGVCQWYNDGMEDYLSALATTLVRMDLSEIRGAVETLREARRKKASVWIVGNGGSAATASHFSNDLIKMAGVRAFSVPDLFAAMLAYGNDEGWDQMFAGAVDTMMLDDDVLVAISCGGRSKNVLKVARLFPPNARIVLTGNNKRSPLAQLACVSCLTVPNEEIRIQEDAHLAVCHMIAGELAHGK